MRLRDGLALGVGLLLAACASKAPETAKGGVSAEASLPKGVYKLGKPYKIAGRWYYPSFDADYDEVGTASWYGAAFHGMSTANGEVFDKDTISAAHPTLPLPSMVRVTNLENGRSVELRVNDRGPFVGDRLIDLSQAAARELGYEGSGLARVRVQFLGLADDARGTPPAPVMVAQAPVMVAQAPVTRSQPAAPVAAPAPAPAPAPPVQVASLDHTSLPAAACDGVARFVQVGAFAESGKVHAATARLEDVAPVHVEPIFVGSVAAARVRLGPLAAGDAARVLAQVQRRGYTDAFLAPAAGLAGPPSCSDT